MRIAKQFLEWSIGQNTQKYKKLQEKVDKMPHRRYNIYVNEVCNFDIFFENQRVFRKNIIITGGRYNEKDN